MADAWEEEIIRFRKGRDEFFAQSENTPLPHEETHSFKGLKYFDISKDFVVKAKLNKYANQEPVLMTTSTGDVERYLKAGYFEFTLGEKTLRLQAYRSEKPEPKSLFVPFRDKTSGRESYGSGRYLDLEPTLDDNYVLDFNNAYNPNCAYSDAYACPLPPKENWLDVEITAGEKKYHW